MIVAFTKDDVVRELTKANADTLDVVIAESRAHQQLKNRGALVQAVEQVLVRPALFQRIELARRHHAVRITPRDQIDINKTIDVSEPARPRFGYFFSR